MALLGYDADASAAWYQALEKPFFAPPSWVFGPVWTVLYILIAVVFATAFYRMIKGELDKSVRIPLFINLVSNLAFTPLQFGLRSNVLALIDIVIVLGSLVWLMRGLWPRMKWGAYALVPYLLWVSFATVLQISVTVLNMPG